MNGLDDYGIGEGSVNDQCDLRLLSRGTELTQCQVFFQTDQMLTLRVLISFWTLSSSPWCPPRTQHSAWPTTSLRLHPCSCLTGCIIHTCAEGAVTPSLKMNSSWDFPGSPVVKTLLFHSRGTDSIPSWGTRISRDAQHGPKKQNKTKPKTNSFCN